MADTDIIDVDTRPDGHYKLILEDGRTIEPFEQNRVNGPNPNRAPRAKDSYHEPEDGSTATVNPYDLDTSDPKVTTHVKCKFKVTSTRRFDDQEEVSMQAVTTGPGNEEWSKWTPSGSFNFVVTNPAVIGKYVTGQEVFITIGPT